MFSTSQVRVGVSSSLADEGMVPTAIRALYSLSLPLSSSPPLPLSIKLIFFYKITYVCIHLNVCHLRTGPRGNLKPESQEMVSHPLWVLRWEQETSVRAEHVLGHRPIPPAPLAVFSLFCLLRYYYYFLLLLLFLSS